MPAVLQWLYNSALITKGSRRPQFCLVPIVLYINYQLLMKTLRLNSVQQLINIDFFIRAYQTDLIFTILLLRKKIIEDTFHQSPSQIKIDTDQCQIQEVNDQVEK